MRRLVLRLFGEFEALQSGGPRVAPRLEKSRALLAYLALCDDPLVSRGRLCALLWSRVEDSQARHSLRQALADIRQALGPMRALLITCDDAVGLDRDRVVCDVVLFDRLAATRRQSALARAARLYRGTFLHGIDLPEPAFDDWRDGELRRLDALARTVLARLHESCDRDSADTPLALASRLVAVDPYDEAVHRALMMLHARRGAKREALRQFEICRRNLRDDLDQEPSPETMAVYDAVRRAKGPYEPAGEPARDMTIASIPASARRTHVIAPAAIVALAIAGFIVWQATQTLSPVAESTSAGDPVLAMPSGPTIAVLPLKNMSGDPADEYFSDGLTEDIITELARNPMLHVLASNMTSQYKGQLVDVREVGRNLGAAYVLEGSVRRARGRVRINAQLIDTMDGGYVWADRYDREIGDVFALQDEINQEIVDALSSRLGIPKAVRKKAVERKSPEQLEAYDNVLHAAHQMYPWNEANYVTAKSLLENALELDPDNARALRELAYLRFQAWFRGHEGGRNPPNEIKEAAIRARDLDPANPRARLVASYAYFFDHQLDLFEHEARKTFELAPHDGRILAELGTMIGYTGQWQRGLNLIQKSHTLLNNGVHGGWNHAFLWHYHYLRGEYDKAIKKSFISPAQDHPITAMQFVAAYGQLGEFDKAQYFWERCHDLDPDWSVRSPLEIWTLWNFRDEDIDKLMDGIFKGSGEKL